MIDVTHSPYNATGDGTTDDRAAIQSAIDAAEAAGGDIVYFPKGTYLLDSAHPSVSGVQLYIDNNNVSLQGEGKGVTIIRQGDGINCSPINFNDTVGGGVSNLEIDGNSANNLVGGHGVRCSDSFINATLKDLFIHHTGGYGIGLQYGVIKGLLIQNVLVEDTRSDGIDIKNPELGNQANKMDNVTVRRAGLNTSLSGQACIDLRGRWNLSNITCEEFNHTSARCLVGIRLRPDGVEGASGGNHCTLNGFYVNSGTTSGTIGVQINGYQCAVSTGVVQGCDTGVEVNYNESSVGEVVVTGCSDGFVVGASGDGGDRVTLTGCIARSCTASGFKIFRTNVQLNGITARSNVHGVNLRNGSVNTIISGLSSSNSGANLNKESVGLTWTNAGFIS